MTKPNDDEPTADRRKQVFEEMLEPTQALAKKLDKLLAVENRGSILIKYDIGQLIHEVTLNDGVYGFKAVEQLGNYVGVYAGLWALYHSRDLAVAFDRENLAKEAANPMVNGVPISVYHFVELARIKTPSRRAALLQRVRAQCLSVDELHDEIMARAHQVVSLRGGRRKLKPPTSPAVGLCRLSTQTQQLVRYANLLDEAVFDALENMTIAEVDENLLALVKQTTSSASAAARSLQHILNRLKDGNKHLRRLLQSSMKPSAAESGEDDVDEVEIEEDLQPA